MTTFLDRWWAGLSDRWKATLRTAWQSIVAAFVLGLLAMLASVTDLVSGEPIDLVQDASNAARVFALAALAALTGIVTFASNRHDPPRYGPD